MAVTPQIHPSWLEVLAPEFQKPYFAELKRFLVEEKAAGIQVFPPGPLIFNAFNLTPFNEVRVVILGQDPYHGPGQAHGLSFSVPEGITPPPSLRNIFKELAMDLGEPDVAQRRSGNLEGWARQGVFLLNAILTVRARQAASHKGRGWEQFTEAVIRALATERKGVVFMLWGKFAQEKAALVDPQRHLVLTSAHPSPYSAEGGFFGSRPFTQANAYLEAQGLPPIAW